MKLPTRRGATGLALLLAPSAAAAQRPERQGPPKPEPTHTDVSDGGHEQNVFDVWLAESEDPT